MPHLCTECQGQCSCGAVSSDFCEGCDECAMDGEDYVPDPEDE